MVIESQFWGELPAPFFFRTSGTGIYGCSSSLKDWNLESPQSQENLWIVYNVNSGLINHGLLIVGVLSPYSHNMILKWCPPN